VAPEVLRASSFCAKVGDICSCDRGFVLIGMGQETDWFGESHEARWGVFPRRVDGSVMCDDSLFGAVSLLPSEEVSCRCFPGNLMCEQTSEPTKNGCGAGDSAKLFNMAFTDAQKKCCNDHDLCYGLCGSTKRGCDAGFEACLRQTCTGVGSSACGLVVDSMLEAVGSRMGSVVFAEVQGKRETYKATDLK